MTEKNDKMIGVTIDVWEGKDEHFSPEQSRAINTLIKSECCNCENDGSCILLERRCPQMIALDFVCDWFSEAVLPLKPELKISLEEKMLDEPKTIVKHCLLCKTIVTGRSTYCPKCAKKKLRESQRKYKFKRDHVAKN